MLTKEHLESWNDIFPDAKIREKDLSAPTEQFLTRTLIAYLHEFDCKMEPPFPLNETVENTREKRLFLLKLTQHIDKILKITNESYTFTYYDLICPAPKKTSHMLRILLNYLFYFNMYKEQVYELARDRINERRMLSTNIKEMKEEDARRKDRKIKIKNEIAELHDEVRKRRSELQPLVAQIEEELAKDKQLEEEMARLTECLEELNIQKINLQKQIVPESEVNEIKMQIKKSEVMIADSKKVQDSVKQRLKETEDAIVNIRELEKKIEEAKTRMPVKCIEIMNENTEQLQKVKMQLNSNQKKFQQNLISIQKLENKLKNLNEKCKKKGAQLEQEIHGKNKIIDEKKRSFNQNTAVLTHMENERQGLDALQNEQMEIAIYIAKNGKNLLSLCR